LQNFQCVHTVTLLSSEFAGAAEPPDLSGQSKKVCSMDVKGIAVLVIGLLVAGSALYVGLWKFLYIDLTMRGWTAAKTNYPRLAEKMNLAFWDAAHQELLFTRVSVHFRL
jgi:hypothetical protein